VEKEGDDDNKNFLGLPTKFDIDEYRIMERFCLSIQDEKTSEALYIAIKGSGAFRVALPVASTDTIGLGQS